eukprot:3346402-Rhodomonas_salina.1
MVSQGFTSTTIASPLIVITKICIFFADNVLKTTEADCKHRVFLARQRHVRERGVWSRGPSSNSGGRSFYLYTL